MVHSTRHWKPLLNGYAGVEPASYVELREAARTFPSRARAAGVPRPRGALRGRPSPRASVPASGRGWSGTCRRCSPRARRPGSGRWPRSTPRGTTCTSSCRDAARRPRGGAWRWRRSPARRSTPGRWRGTGRGIPATEWDVAGDYSWAPDEIVPSAVLEGLDRRFSGGWHAKYPPFHYAILAAAYAPWLGQAPSAARTEALVRGRPRGQRGHGRRHRDPGLPLRPRAARPRARALRRARGRARGPARLLRQDRERGRAVPVLVQRRAALLPARARATTAAPLRGDGGLRGGRGGGQGPGLRALRPCPARPGRDRAAKGLARDPGPPLLAAAAVAIAAYVVFANAC